MDTPAMLALLDRHIAALDDLQPTTDSPAFQTWKQTTTRTLMAALGPDDDLVAQFRHLRFSIMKTVPVSPAEAVNAFNRDRNFALGILAAAKHHLQLGAADAVRDLGIDLALWEHVAHLVESGRWDQVASQAAIFVEDRLRTWAGLGSEHFGESLMNEVLHPDNGKFPLGGNVAERQGWHRLGTGFAKALRNVDTHRIQQRDDLNRYAVGVLGTASLLVTQIRYEHADRLLEPDER